MKTISQIIKEEIYKLNQEGVADKYGEKFGLTNPDDEMNRIAMSGIKNDASMGKFIGKTENSGANVFQNPKSLNNFDANVRAVSDEKGDLYVLQNNSDDYHTDIALLLLNKNLFNVGNPNEVYMGNYITFHRIGSTNKFGVSVSYKSYLEDDEEYYELDDHLSPAELFEAVKRKNPNFEFIPKYWEYIR
jgi:hypothetical protein